MKQGVFQLKPAIYYGINAVNVISTIPYERALIITDPFMKSSSMLQELLGQLRNQESYRIFSDIYPDPDTALVSAGIKFLLSWMPDLVIAFGGGSTIDAAKSILYCTDSMNHDQKKITFIAIPTTSGTGSEVTNFAVITMDGKKIPVVDDNLLPDVAIIDAAFTESVPPIVTADTGVDVLTHAIEAYVSTKASNYSDALAEKAVSLVFSYLPCAVKDGKDEKARMSMHDASCIAGIAFTNASLGINHSMAHTLGGAFHIPHGRANAMLLPLIIEYNASDPRAAERYSRLARLIGFSPATVEEGVQLLLLAVRTLLKSTGIPATLAEMNIDYDEFKERIMVMCQTAFADKCTATNPVQPAIADLEQLFYHVYGKH